MTRAETENTCTCCYHLLSPHRVLHHTLPTTGQAQVETHTWILHEHPLKYSFGNQFLAVHSSKMNILVKLVLCFVCLYAFVILLINAHVSLCSLFEVWHAGETSQPSPTSQHSWPWSEDWEHARFPAPKQESGQSEPLAAASASCQVQSRLFKFCFTSKAVSK